MNPRTNDDRNGWSPSYPLFSSSYPPRRAQSLGILSASDRRIRRHSYSNGSGNNRMQPWNNNTTTDASTAAILGTTATTTSLISVASGELRQLENEMPPQPMNNIRLENALNAGPDSLLNNQDPDRNTSTGSFHEESNAQLPVEAFSFGCRAHDSSGNAQQRTVSLQFMNESLPFLSRTSSNPRHQSWSSSFPMVEQQPNVTLAELIQQVLDITETVLSFSDDHFAAEETNDDNEQSIVDDGEGDDDDGDDNVSNNVDLQNTNNESTM